MGGYVNKEVCVNIELFLLVFVKRGVCTRKKSASWIRSSRMNVLWFLMDFCQVSYRCGLLKVGKFDALQLCIFPPKQDLYYANI